MDKRALRATFERMIGQERYRKFLLALHGVCTAKGRLFFWQEQQWEAFREEHNIPEHSFDEIRAAFLYCHVHDIELLEDTVSVQYGTRATPSEEEVAHAQATYPYAMTFVAGPCWVEEVREKKVFYCPKCRAAFASEHAERV